VFANVPRTVTLQSGQQELVPVCPRPRRLRRWRSSRRARNRVNRVQHHKGRQIASAPFSRCDHLDIRYWPGCGCIYRGDGFAFGPIRRSRPRLTSSGRASASALVPSRYGRSSADVG
jgi:hypothetical protein